MAQTERDEARRNQTTESSTIISLGELMQMEQHRIDDERRRRETQPNTTNWHDGDPMAPLGR